jgi:hypothetical protein
MCYVQHDTTFNSRRSLQIHAGGGGASSGDAGHSDLCPDGARQSGSREKALAAGCDEVDIKSVSVA